MDAPSPTPRRPSRPSEHVILDALALEVGPERAPSVLETTLAQTLGELPDVDDPAALRRFVRGPLHSSLRVALSPAEADVVVRTAEALLAPLQRDRLCVGKPIFRAPYVLVSSKHNDLEGVVELRRVECLLDLLIEADAVPSATLVVDAWRTSMSLVTLALAASDLPESTAIVIVGASDDERLAFTSASHRGATFLERFIPLGILPPAAVSLARQAA